MSDKTIPKKAFISPTTGLIILMVLHGVGIIGIVNNLSSSLFISLTPLHLLVSAVILFSFHRDWRSYFIFFMVLTFILGFFVEVLGIQTGTVFGQYSYSPVLGPSLFDTPIIIGVNWLMLIYATGIICNRISNNILIRALCAMSLMILLDIFIEPVAIKLDFWQWESATIPLQNYFAWGIVSFLLLYFFYFLPFAKENAIATKFYLVQISFFIALNLLL
ncbi:MAG: carotenoid biosynthesis protein [Bacteroidota bacterium]|nr:carotenoid biosynthesis protein [Bacteroidota bacterium]